MGAPNIIMAEDWWRTRRARHAQGSGEFPVPSDENERLQLLHRLDILDTAAEASFENLVDWGRRRFNVTNLMLKTPHARPLMKCLLRRCPYAS